MQVKITPKQMAIIAILLFVFSLFLFKAVKGQHPKPLHTGWYSVKWLKKKGYSVPENAPKRIYVHRTADSAKANIKPLSAFVK